MRISATKDRVFPAVIGAGIGIFLCVTYGLKLKWEGCVVILACATIGAFHDKWL